MGYLKPIIKADLLTKGPTRYNPVLRIAEDYDFILRLLLDGARMRVYPELTYRYLYVRHCAQRTHSRAFAGT